MRNLALTLCVLASSGASAQGIEFKGLPLGSPREALLDKYPSVRCVVSTPQFALLGEEVCHEQAGKGEIGTYAGAQAQANFSVVAGNIEGFHVDLAASAYSQVRDALKEVYGAGIESSKIVTNRVGTQFTARTWLFTNESGTMRLHERYNAVDRAALEALSPALEAYRAKLRANAPKKNAKDL